MVPVGSSPACASFLGASAQFGGNGGIDPTGDPFKFMISATDGSPDAFRIRIWWEDVDAVEADVYAIGIYGTGYRRVTSLPACASLAGLPMGSVTANVTNSVGPLAELYVQGAPGPKSAENGTIEWTCAAACESQADSIHPKGGLS